MTTLNTFQPIRGLLRKLMEIFRGKSIPKKPIAADYVNNPRIKAKLLKAR